MAQYTLLAECADRVSERRTQSNRTYLLACLGILGLGGVVSGGPLEELQMVWLLVICLGGLAICGLWKLTLNSSKVLNKEKFRILQEMERSLPFQPYADEWSAISSTHRRFTSLEGLMPLAFAVFFVALGIWTALGPFAQSTD